MTCSTSSCAERQFAIRITFGDPGRFRGPLGIALLALAACAGGGGAVWPGHPDESEPVRLALLPPENLSGGPAPLDALERVAERALARTGVEVASGAPVDDFLARHRIRSTGGLDREGARAAREELGVSGVVITSVVLHGELTPPSFGVTMRLVSAAEEPEILWIDAFGRTGDDRPGLLGLGRVESVRRLEEEAFEALARSLAGFLRDARRKAPGCRTSPAFAPKIAFRSPALGRKEALSVAVLPFVNESGRRGAGQVLALEMARQLLAVDRVRVIEPGMLRDELLTYRISDEGGATPATARLLARILDADLVVGGVVRDYVEHGLPALDFSVLAIEPETEEVVWESASYGNGNEAMGLFGTGKVSTAGVLACRMTRALVEQMMARRKPRGRPGGRT
jgi:TolB-like protein